jgi:hypothetical protein
VKWFRNNLKGLSGAEDSVFGRMTAAVAQHSSRASQIVYRAELEAEAAFYRRRTWALSRRILVKSKGKLYMPGGATLTEAA